MLAFNHAYEYEQIRHNFASVSWKVKGTSDVKTIKFVLLDTNCNSLSFSSNWSEEGGKLASLISAFQGVSDLLKALWSANNGFNRGFVESKIPSWSGSSRPSVTLNVLIADFSNGYSKVVKSAGKDSHFATSYEDLNDLIKLAQPDSVGTSRTYSPDQFREYSGFVPVVIKKGLKEIAFDSPSNLPSNIKDAVELAVTPATKINTGEIDNHLLSLAIAVNEKVVMSFLHHFYVSNIQYTGSSQLIKVGEDEFYQPYITATIQLQAMGNLDWSRTVLKSVGELRSGSPNAIPSSEESANKEYVEKTEENS